MRVKRLEIQGFKSFKDKTVIHFDHSITGIVGPNGCGKSNIVDAFFWVMGEQSYKHMRGSSSEDLIFNGSSKYSPLGLAEATLVLETNIPDPASAPAGASVQDTPLPTRTKEISVTRRLYRSGEGEYFINGNPSRLKDIHELFMDTGVGTKGYSVIEQGQIGKIVNAKPEDRRLLIEEAAGIAKYKARKKESLRKIEATQANLARLTDIIQEIEKNLASLDRQAQKARLYKKYKEELTTKELHWARKKKFQLLSLFTELQNRKETLEQDLIGLAAELQSNENLIETDRIHLLTETQEVDLLQNKIQQLSGELTKKQSALDLSRRRLGDISTQLESFESEKAELEKSIQEGGQAVQDLQQQVEESNAVLQIARSEAQGMDQSVYSLRKEVEKGQTELNQFKQKLLSQLNQISEFTSRATGLLSKIEAAQGHREKLSLQTETQNHKLVSIQEELGAFKAQQEQLQIQREENKQELEIQRSSINSLDQSVRDLEKARNDAHRTLTQLKSRLQSLEELEEAHEGLSEGPKAALEWAKANGAEKALTPLTRFLSVNPGYENVLESWLEKKIESLFLQDSQFALPMIEKIRESKQGRIRIQMNSSGNDLPNSSLTSFETIRGVLEKQGFQILGTLEDFVSIPSENHSLIHPLISQVCIVENSQPLTLLLESPELQNFRDWSIASMDGTILEKGQLLRGGSGEGGGAIAILKRKRTIAELQVQVTDAKQALDQSEAELLEMKQRAEIARARLQTLQEDLRNLDVQTAALQRDIHQTQRAHQEVESHLALLKRDSEEIDDEVERACSEREELETLIQEKRADHLELEERINLLSQSVSEFEKNLRTQESDLQTIRLREATTQERTLSLQKELSATRSLLSDRERRIQEIRRTLERASREKDEFKDQEPQLLEEIEILTYSLADSRERLADVKDRMEQMNAKVSGAHDIIKEIHKKRDLKTTESTQLALELEKLNGELNHLILNLEEKYGVGCLNPTQSEIEALSTTEPLNPHPADDADLTEEVEKLRERLRRLGEVNLMAIEEYDQLKERHEHLIHEKSDLERSMENLQEAIEHINKTSEDRFQKAFEAIADRFERLFPIIFGGGQAKLSLVYPEGSKDILEAGVDILAQPPGKKVANITLLSGGEKALTAVSLIFAIFMIKPSPFCVLDEVDAPLDDANIGKFNALLREMSAKSQFIVITHNKKTMELNDTLYGVTMEEPGVSKMVSIELR